MACIWTGKSYPDQTTRNINRQTAYSISQFHNKPSNTTHPYKRGDCILGCCARKGFWRCLVCRVDIGAGTLPGQINRHTKAELQPPSYLRDLSEAKFVQRKLAQVVDTGKIPLHDLSQNGSGSGIWAILTIHHDVPNGIQNTLWTNKAANTSAVVRACVTGDTRDGVLPMNKLTVYLLTC